ncbi:MAG: SDH family Clp fold serine proteinase [Desulfovermiculus sp.]
MQGVELFWIFLIFISLQPLFKQRMIAAARKRTLAKLEKIRSSRVILLVHRQETMSFLGFPLMRYIDVNDSEEVLRAIHLTDNEVPLDIVLHTPGGLVLASLQIARAIKEHPAKVTVYVPHYAMSGGTLIALAADEIVLAPHAVLGPVDPQIGQSPGASLLRVLRDKSVQDIEDKTLIAADMAEKALYQIEHAVVDLIQERYSPDKAEEIAQLLTQGHWTHDYPITYANAREIGLPVTPDMPEMVYQLMALYPQPVRRSLGVEYIPEPRSDPRGKREQ